MYVNVKLMSSLKKKIRNRHFIIRSIISSSIAELIATCIAYPLVFYHTTHSLFNLIISAYLFKLVYSIFGAFPAKFIVFLLRYVDGVKQESFSKELSNFSQKR
jgi:uncharacterized PurR-regulated membrane protein YhhQ (DUF165 family)